MTGYENIIMGAIIFVAFSPVAFFSGFVVVGVVRALKDGIRND